MAKKGLRKKSHGDLAGPREIEGTAGTGKGRTHDTSLASYHIRDIKSFADTLNSAATRAYPNRGKSRYTGVNVLLLSWVDDDLGVKKEVDELERVFRRDYRFRTENWKIPSGPRAHHHLTGKLWHFIEDYDNQDRLLIVYYGGHGGMNDDRQCVWSNTNEPDCSTVRWSGLQTELEEAASDVLILLDCCAAASSAAGPENNITEVIAACGFETTAPGVGNNSFTRSLIDELEYLSNRPAFSAAELHNKILSRIKSLKPKAVDPKTGKPIEKRKTPIHITLSNPLNRPSIQLSPVESSSPYPPKLSREFSNMSILSEAATIVQIKASTNGPSADALQPDPRYDDPKVMISVALEEDQILDIAQWITWLTSIPNFAIYAHIEGVYRSDSTLLLLSLPVAVWDLLPENPAISFIGFVRSRNLLEGQTATGKGTSPIEKPNDPPATPTCHPSHLSATGHSPEPQKDEYIIVTPPKLQQQHEFQEPPRRWADVVALSSTHNRRKSRSRGSGTSGFIRPSTYHPGSGNPQTRRPNSHSRSSSACSRESGSLIIKQMSSPLRNAKAG